MSPNLSTRRQIVNIDVIREFTTSVIKWFLLLNLGLVWIFFWGNLARLHLSMDDYIGAIVTIGLFIVPIIIAVPLWVAKKADLGPVGFPNTLPDSIH